MPHTHDIYLEIGQKKVFAGAVAWPGWCRSGRDEESAIQALFQTGPRYAQALESTDLAFRVPGSPADLQVLERAKGSTTTDFGAPDMPMASDEEPIDANELARLQTLLKACWLAFDKAVQLAEGKQLRVGPRGGGRDRMEIIDHVAGAEVSYLMRIGWKVEAIDAEQVDRRLVRIRSEILCGLQASAAGQLPEAGPRGGKRWSPRFFVRRVAWHVLDHAWEIEDRIIKQNHPQI
jgi:hypothetical protein